MQRTSKSRAARSGVAATLLAAVCLLPGAAPALQVGDPAVDFSAPQLTGSGNLQLADYRGKVVVLDFWASWCPPCLVSLPALEQLRNEFPADSFQIVAVNLDRDPERATELLAKLGVRYPSASDPAGRIPEEFGLATMPTSYLIDRQGIVRHVHEGFRSGDIDGLRDRIQALIQETGR